MHLRGVPFRSLLLALVSLAALLGAVAGSTASSHKGHPRINSQSTNPEICEYALTASSQCKDPDERALYLAEVAVLYQHWTTRVEELATQAVAKLRPASAPAAGNVAADPFAQGLSGLRVLKVASIVVKIDPRLAARARGSVHW